MDYTPYLILIISLVGLVYLGYRYTSLFVKINNLENEFSSIINHAFRTPLTRILWLSKEIEGNLSLNERLSHIQKITNATNKILGIVDIVAGIKKISDISGYYFEAVSIREIIEKSMEKYRDSIREKNLIFKVSSFEDIPLLSVDLKKISFVIDALIENAILYTPLNGKILIDSITDNKNLIFFISDTGLGLSIIDKLRIFSRFYRNKKAVLMNTEGMGLCLYLSKKIIKRHHGKIYAKSNGRNKGSTFFLELPFNK